MITFHFYLCIIVLKLFKIHIYERTAITVMLWYATWELLCNFLFNKVTMKAMCDPPMFYVIVLSLLSFLPYLISQIKSAMVQILHVFKNIIYIYIYIIILSERTVLYTGRFLK